MAAAPDVGLVPVTVVLEVARPATSMVAEVPPSNGVPASAVKRTVTSAPATLRKLSPVIVNGVDVRTGSGEVMSRTWMSEAPDEEESLPQATAVRQRRPSTKAPRTRVFVAMAALPDLRSSGAVLPER